MTLILLAVGDTSTLSTVFPFLFVRLRDFHIKFVVSVCFIFNVGLTISGITVFGEMQ